MSPHSAKSAALAKCFAISVRKPVSVRIRSPHMEKPRARKGPTGAALIADQVVSRARSKNLCPLYNRWRFPQSGNHIRATEQPDWLHEARMGRDRTMAGVT